MAKKADAQVKAPEEQKENTEEETSVETPEVDLPSPALGNYESVLLPNEGIEIFPNKPLSDFTRLRGAKTYFGQGENGEEYVAYLCQKGDIHVLIQ